jgi:hypothetical protein
LAMMFAHEPAASFMGGTFERYSPQLDFLIAATGIFLTAAGAWWIWRGISLVSDYFDFVRQSISELYVREVPISDLSRVNSMFRHSLERNGLRSAKWHALKQIMSLGPRDISETAVRYFSQVYSSEFVR